MTQTGTHADPAVNERRSRTKAQASSPPAPPGPPPAATSPDHPRPGRDDLIPMRGFGPMPARLSPVKAGEIFVKAPSILRLEITGGEFAFYPWDDRLAPFLGPHDLVYARHGLPSVGDLVFAMPSDGKPLLGFLTAAGEEGIVLEASGTTFSIGPGDLLECASLVLIHRNGRPEATVHVPAAGPREPPSRAA